MCLRVPVRTCNCLSNLANSIGSISWSAATFEINSLAWKRKRLELYLSIGSAPRHIRRAECSIASMPCTCRSNSSRSTFSCCTSFESTSAPSTSRRTAARKIVCSSSAPAVRKGCCRSLSCSNERTESREPLRVLKAALEALSSAAPPPPSSFKASRPYMSKRAAIKPRTAAPYCSSGASVLMLSCSFSMGKMSVTTAPMSNPADRFWKQA
mmetsp:Transcript_4358/g.10679  ORF Transcript_4358/g.10679 Transcript_4358/m.10679 type:complete len:211 (-) Transcript_4358:199-831(-)